MPQAMMYLMKFHLLYMTIQGAFNYIVPWQIHKDL